MGMYNLSIYKPKLFLSWFNKHFEFSLYGLSWFNKNLPSWGYVNCEILTNHEKFVYLTNLAVFFVEKYLKKFINVT